MKRLFPSLLLPLVVTLSANAQDVRSGLVAFWPLDALSPDETTTPDAAGFADLTTVNIDSSNLVAGRHGNAVTFNGSDELLFRDTDFDPVPGLPLQANVRKTIAFWVKGDGTIQQDKRIFAEASMASTSPLFDIGTDNAASARTAKADIYIRNDAGTALTNHLKSAGLPLDGTWHHFALTDNNGAVRMYIDGVLDTTTITYTRSATTMTTLSLGAIQRLNGAVAFFNGALDDVAVWDRILSAAEIQEVMNNGIATPIPPLVTADRAGPYLEGDRVALTARAYGVGPFSYQWRQDGVDIPGATEPLLVIPALTAATDGSYDVVVNGTDTSPPQVLAFTADPAADLTQNIVSWWPFDDLNEAEFPPTTPDPWGGDALTCWDMDNTNLVEGKFGQALQFDGVTEYSYRTSGFPVAGNPEYTVACWVKADGTVQSDLRFFAEGSDVTNTPLLALGTATDSSDHLRVLLRSDSGTVLAQANSTAAVLDDSWHHVVWTDRNGNARLYVDGQMDATIFDYNRTGQTLTLNQTSVGAIQRAATTHWIFGAVDDVAVWNRALTWTEIQALKTTSVPAPVAAVPPVVTQDPAARTVYEGRTVTFSIQATGTGPLNYQWLKDGNPVPEGIESTLTLESTVPGQSGSYTCRVSNSAGTDTSEAAALSVLPVLGLETAMLTCWALDSGDSTTPDSIGGQDMTLFNLDVPGAYQPGVIGNALYFDGVDDLLVHTRTGVGTDIPLTSREEYSIAFWVQGFGVGQSDRRIFAEASTVNTNPLFNIGTATAGDSDLLNFYIRGDSGTVPINHLTSFVPVLDGAWHHVVYTDYNGQGQLFVDGVADLTLNYTRIASTFTNVSIGGIGRATPSHWFAGGVDQLCTWGRAITETEALGLFEAAVPPAPTMKIKDFAVVNDILTITVSTQFGDIGYYVESTDNVATGPWNIDNDAIVGTLTGGTFTAELPAPVPGTRRFYRVVTAQ